MSISDDFLDLLSDAGRELSSLGKELRSIGRQTLDEIRQDPERYLQESVRDLAAMGVRHPALDQLGKLDAPLPPAATVLYEAPKPGCIVYTDLLGGLAEHSGVYVGKGKIVELNQHGKIKLVSPAEFTNCSIGKQIHVSCRQGKPAGSAVVARRARASLGDTRDYNLLLDNCHQFSSGCLSGNFANSDNFLWMLKTTAAEKLGADHWGVWYAD